MVYHFFTALTRHFRDWCQESGRYSSLYRKRKRLHFVQDYALSRDTVLDFEAEFQEELQHLEQKRHPNAKKLGIIIQHIVRNPLDVVISRYNYHLSHPDKYYGDPGHGQNRVEQVELVSHIRDGLPCDKAMYMECCERMGISPDEYSIADMLAYDLKLGIECEYDTFQRCYYADLYESYAELQRIALREDDNPRYHISNFRLEDFNGPQYKVQCQSTWHQNQ